MISFTMNKWLRHNDADDVSLYVQECGGHFDQGSMNIQCNPCGSGWSYIRN